MSKRRKEYIRQLHISWWASAIFTALYIYGKEMPRLVSEKDFLDLVVIVQYAYLSSLVVVYWMREAIKLYNCEQMKMCVVSTSSLFLDVIPTIIVIGISDYLILRVCVSSLLSNTPLWFCRYTLCMILIHNGQKLVWWLCDTVGEIRIRKKQKEKLC